MRAGSIICSLALATLPAAAAAQVEVTPFVGSNMPQRYFGFDRLDANGFRMEQRSRFAEGVQLGARATSWVTRRLGAELSVATSRHERRIETRGVDPVTGYATRWSTERAGDVRALVVGARAMARANPRGGPVALHAGAGVVHVRWGDNPLSDRQSDGGTGLSLAAGLRVRVAERLGARLDVESDRYTFGEFQRVRANDVAVTVGLSLAIGR
ncbi:MAG TPA: outer membrane beta-barrel protein [Gemmatimonadaceae bacterium]|nr:outer membrane beta-barrel protein [Gemmatimonadaceae bacterium]